MKFKLLVTCSFIDINSTTTKISEKLCASDLVRPNPVYLHLPVSNPPLWTDTGVQISELPADDPDSILVTQIMQRVDESFSKFKVNYEGPIVVSFI
ncbi:hypothetical protein HMI56_003823 [Coelomomyces lativittatus]|nr:hypothetical protein HMI56_003823 [Coelomomyces lativittatus]